MLDAKLGTGSVQFLLANLAQGLTCGDASIPDLPSLAACRRHDHRLGAGRSVSRQGTAGAEYLIVGVGEHAKNTWLVYVGQLGTHHVLRVVVVVIPRQGVPVRLPHCVVALTIPYLILVD